MTSQQFITKWKPVTLTERAAAHTHFIDLCALVGHEDPVKADPTREWFTFEKGAAGAGLHSDKAPWQCIEEPLNVLKTYREALAQYHLRPEHKFLNANYTDSGITRRRYVEPTVIRRIGKESNRWEKQFYLGSDEGADIDYGTAPDNEKALFDQIRPQITSIGQRKVARESGVARRTIERLMQGKKVRDAVVAKICRFLDSR
jgi:hypothetical protein